MERIQTRFGKFKGIEQSDVDLDINRFLSRTPIETYNKSKYMNTRDTINYRKSQKMMINSIDSIRNEWKPKRQKKIFDKNFSSTGKTIDVLNKFQNVKFEQLDNTFFPAFLQFKECGCENTLKPCARIYNQLTSEKLSQMKLAFENLLESDTPRKFQKFEYSVMKSKFRLLPHGYSQILYPTLEKLIKILPSINEKEFLVLAYIVLHTKLDYLSYWIYVEINSNLSPYDQVSKLIRIYSKDLQNNLNDLQEYFDLQKFSYNFHDSRATNIIPIFAYGRYLEFLNKIGRSYPAKVLFTYLLYHSNEFQKRGYYGIEKHLQKVETPWIKILEAATNTLLG